MWESRPTAPPAPAAVVAQPAEQDVDRDDACERVEEKPLLDEELTTAPGLPNVSERVAVVEGPVTKSDYMAAQRHLVWPVLALLSVLSVIFSITIGSSEPLALAVATIILVWWLTRRRWNVYEKNGGWRGRTVIDAGHLVSDDATFGVHLDIPWDRVVGVLSHPRRRLFVLLFVGPRLSLCIIPWSGLSDMGAFVALVDQHGLWRTRRAVLFRSWRWAI